jgi:Outer membrane protein beta-barrel domain
VKSLTRVGVEFRNHVRFMTPYLAVLILLRAVPGFAQSIQWGVKGGVPITGYFHTATQFGVPLEGITPPGNFPISAEYQSSTNRYTVGPTVEVNLPRQMGVEFDALYKWQRYNGFSYSSSQGPQSPADSFVNFKTTADSWEFPILLKYHSPGPRVGTFLEVGASFQHLSNILQTRSNFPTLVGCCELRHSFNQGFVMGGGIEFRLKSVKVSPGFRSTIWRYNNFSSQTSAVSNGLLNSSKNQFEFLMGITLPLHKL